MSAPVVTPATIPPVTYSLSSACKLAGSKTLSVIGGLLVFPVDAAIAVFEGIVETFEGIHELFIMAAIMRANPAIPTERA